MIYIILFSIFTVYLIITPMIKRKYDIAALIFGIIIVILSVFRYGSGTDYFGYQYQYIYSPSNILNALSMESHMEIGYRILVSLFKSIKIDFIVFVMAISLFMLSNYFFAIYNNSRNKLLSFIILYSTYYHIYVNSAFRQGIAMSIVFGAIYTYLKNKSMKRYYLCVIIASLFHKSALIAVFIPIIGKVFKKILDKPLVLISTIFITIIMYLVRFDVLFLNIFRLLGIDFAYNSSGANIWAIILRLINIFIVLYTYSITYKNIDEFTKFQLRIYILGNLIFFVVCNIPILSRLTEYFLILEVIFLPNLLVHIKGKINRVIWILGITSILAVVLVKDIKSFTYQGDYYNKEVLSYPYISIFNKEKIYQYRYIEDIFVE